MKEESTTHTQYMCEYCKDRYYSPENAIECEASHTPVGVGDRAEYTETAHHYDHGKPYSYDYGVSGTIIKEEDGKFLIEHDDGERVWKETWEIYR